MDGQGSRHPTGCSMTAGEATMIDTVGEALNGGMMNTPIRLDNKVYRKATKSTATIHRLLKHVRSKGIEWVPEPISFDNDTEVLSFMKGEVPHDMPEWIWTRNVLSQIATHMRDWHDATEDFAAEDAQWSFQTASEPHVICHNDFAPYNCVFDGTAFAGLIDFDLCAPGSRLWDMAYTAYRFIPVMPKVALEAGEECSPFDTDEMNQRMEVFLQAYAMKSPTYTYTREELLSVITKRLLAISEWTRNYAEETNQAALMANAFMYKRHAVWVQGLL